MRRKTTGLPFNILLGVLVFLLPACNMSSGTIFAAGLTLTIPQSGHPFPAPRALRPHPATYTVPEQTPPCHTSWSLYKKFFCHWC